jgi:uncharacterized membrane protein YbhN (UPF0104 family)
MNDAPAPAPRPRGKVWQKLVLSLLPAAAIVWLMQHGALPIVPRREDLARIAVWTVPAGVLVWCASYFARLARWYFLLAPVQTVPLRTVLRVNAVGLFAISILPFRMGEVARPLMIRKPPRLTFWAASGTIAGERIIDALAVSLVLLLGLSSAPPRPNLPDHVGALPVHVDWVPRAAVVSALFFAGVCAVMAIFYFWRAWAERVTRAVVGVVSVKLGRWLAAKIAQVAEGLGFLAYRRYAVPYLVMTALYWVLNVGVFWVIAVGCGLGHIGFAGVAATMGVVAIGIILPATPGFFGTFQFATYVGLAMYLDEKDVQRLGSVYAFLVYVVPIGLTALVGIAGILAKPSALLSLNEADAAASPAAKTWPVEGEQATAER